MRVFWCDVRLGLWRDECDVLQFGVMLVFTTNDQRMRWMLTNGAVGQADHMSMLHIMFTLASLQMKWVAGQPPARIPSLGGGAVL